MNIQPYFPEPEEVDGNIAAAAYEDRLRFIRRTIWLHAASLVVVMLVVWALPTSTPLREASLFFLGALVTLSLARTVTRGTRLDSVLSSLLLMPTLILVGVWLRSLHEDGWPVWSVAFSAMFVLCYSVFCGKDLSFLGMFSLCSIALAVVVAPLAFMGHATLNELSLPFALGVLYLLYYSYDLASLLQRRKPGEEVAAVADLYRDVLNFFGYALRVANHWRKFRI